MVGDAVRIVPFTPAHREAWRTLNEGWLHAGGFEIEPKDRKTLDDPEGIILACGGRIFMAEQTGEPVGCCALLPMPDGGAEIAKMTVVPAARGGGVGRRLLQACETEALSMGATRLYLETNSALKPALALYRRFGFDTLPSQPTDYARCDVWMEKRF